MSDLQIGLILLGIVLILGVLLFNWWQDRRIRRQIAEQFSEHRHDPLMSESPSGSRMEPGLGGGTAAATPPSAAAAVDDDIPDIDAAIEVVIDIGFGHGVTGEQLQHALTGLTPPSGQALRLVVITEAGAHHAQPKAGHSYQSLQLVALLANRSGPLSAIDWSRLWTFAQGLADDTDGTLEGPDFETVEQRAQALDAQCAELDAQVGIVLQLNQPKPLREISQKLADTGFAEQQGQWRWLNNEGQTRFMVLIDAGATGQMATSSLEQLDFVLDLPHTVSDRHAFSHMAEVARKLAADLGAKLLDDSGKALPDHADATIDEHLHQLYEALETAGFAAGQARTIRVFS